MMMNTYIKKGFTLIELLIVMAILGVLAVVVLVAINPVQQLARTRDSGRKSTVTQVGHAVEAYFTSRGGEYLDTTNCTGLAGGWMACLQTAGEISSVPAAIANSVGSNGTCSVGADGVQNDLCYAVDGTSTAAIVYTILESETEESKCTNVAAPVPYFVYSTEDGRGGTLCLAAAAAPAAGTAYGGSYLED